MTSLKMVDPQVFIAAFAQHLERGNKITVPAYADYVKTGSQKEMPPQDPKWFYTRTAAIARQVYLKPSLGVGQLANHFGGRKRRGVRPGHHQASGTKIIRNSLQELQKIGFLSVSEDGGRTVTKDGIREMEKVAELCLQ